MNMIGLPEILIILFIIVLILGPKKLPQLAKSIGKAVREYRKAAEEPVTKTRRKKRKPKGKPAG